MIKIKEKYIEASKIMPERRIISFDDIDRKKTFICPIYKSGWESLENKYSLKDIQNMFVNMAFGC